MKSFFLAAAVFFMMQLCASQFVTLDTFIRDDEGPQGLSGITPIGESGMYFCIDDTDGLLHKYKVSFKKDGEIESFKLIKTIKLEGVKDGEALSLDPLTGRVFVADERGKSLSSYDPNTGKRISKVDIPKMYFTDMRINRGLESLTISRDGLSMWLANEDTLKCDGEIATKVSGGKVRFTQFVRSKASEPWKVARTVFYYTDPIGGDPYKTMEISGVAEILADDDGSLLVLEREMSMKNPLFPTFRGRLYRVEVKGVANGAMVAKRLLWNENTGFSNYEGFCFAPKSPRGEKRLMLVSDAGHSAAASVMIISQSAKPKGLFVSVQPLADDDLLEPSVQNEVDMALSRASKIKKVEGKAKLPFSTDGLTHTQIAIKLVSKQKADGRWVDGTNDYTAAAVEILKKL